MQELDELVRIRESIIPRANLKRLAKRNNHMGLLFLAFHLAVIAATGWLVFASRGTLWIVPAIFLHGAMLATLFAPMHEAAHGTAFKSVWLNEAVLWLCALIYIFPPHWFRYHHAFHHTYTQVRRMDSAMVLPKPITLGQYLVYVSGLTIWKRNLSYLFGHALGRIDPAERSYAPEDQYPGLIRQARIMLLIYAAVAVVAIAYGSWAPVIYWLLPRVAGESYARWMRVAEHTGCAEGSDPRTNTRTTLTNAFIRQIWWNMPYHAEHHLCAFIPFHALPRFHLEVRDELTVAPGGYFSVHAELFRKFIRWNHATPTYQ
ncbi:fatty acid desaturase [Sphingorhabdus sp. EL138]|jgi:fatty acid desaturase|uniref:fatty acid desaturase n=1 Tax=Sphingorhabdus sp. EL138 TaxID=2073156 RepID=UPI0025FBCF0B|nr:fatty acid desaturase [Sphingorhabdus sp. EL138]